jgi:hypothetical protein
MARSLSGINHNRNIFYNLGFLVHRNKYLAF